MSRLPRSFIIFLLVVSVGVLFVGCTKQEPAKSFEEFTFTNNDLQRVNEEVSSSTPSIDLTQPATSTGDVTTLVAATGTASATVNLTQPGAVPSSTMAAVMNPEKQKEYDNLRMGAVDQGANIYRVNNAFLNVRSSTTVGSTQVERLNQGDMVTVLEIPSAQWAKVRMQDGKEGYVAFRYLAKLTTEEGLAAAKKIFEGQYFVDFAFLNMRKDPSTQAEKTGELPGQAIVKPLSINGEWAHVVWNGQDGYVSAKYLKPFLPTFLVRQDSYAVPILQYRATDADSMTALNKHVAALKNAGMKIVTMKALNTLVHDQEKRDTRLSPGTVILTIAGVTAKNVKSVSDALQASGVSATLFVPTREIGMAGITEKTILTLMANGNEIQSEGHTGDDLRSLTDAQLLLELSQSKQLIEQITHNEVYAVSYPQGGTNDRVMKAAANVGYLFGVSQAPDKKFTRSQFLRLPSMYISASMSAQDVLGMVK